ncbi:prephenate dehydratase [Chryseotalea sanaruensis]|uniref:prephenate dehydratase n=1 Tax=Chryseotalea sanaruensis TaxID=2482724 RepID=A0A401UFK6_9BACT|nr:prephenate dehydratase [Chryseotalea sanaruensis]GCC53652.1 prephenate dehydratase [Chryseotalea sanaruensis]
MKRIKEISVAIQGIATCFHEVAAHTYFGKGIKTVECLSFHALCESLKKEETDFAVMAIENSIAGSILPNYFLLQEYHFSIVGELYVPIHMHLLALPGVELTDLTLIESHPMAIRQCSEFLHSLNNVTIVESEDTALSARHVMELQRKNVAAIANEFAAKKFGLQILKRRIETHKKNFTRFLVLTRKQPVAELGNKASLYFEVSHSIGSLADILTNFKKNQLNLTKIQSIPIIGRPQEYLFHVDVEWRDRSGFEKSIKQVSKHVGNLNVLGEYKKGKIEIN